MYKRDAILRLVVSDDSSVAFIRPPALWGPCIFCVARFGSYDDAII